MALQFVFGGSGSGKTRYLYEEAVRLAEADRRASVFFMVPEQFTMQAQKEIISLHPSHGMMNIDVLSFRRLAYRVFEELAVRNLTVLDDMGKSMVLRRVAAEKKRELGLYQGQLGKNGFIGQLKSMLSEFYQYGVTPDRLGELEREASRPLLRQKLRDMGIIYRGFQEYIEDRFVTAEEILETLCRVLPDSELVKNSVILLDGYTGFTPVQYRILRLLLTYAKDVAVSVTVDPAAEPYKEASIQHLFYMGKHTVCRLERLAKEAGAEKKEDVVLKGQPRFSGSTALAYLERRLFRPGEPFGEKEGDRPLSDQIQVYQAKSPAEEIRFTATRIEEAVRREGFRYRDMAVVTGALSEYGREIAHQFEAAGIPFFLDNKKKIVENPLVELIRSALEVISQDFSYESVFRYLKCGLTGTWRQEAEPEGTGCPWQDRIMTDRLENYVRALGIRGFRRWNSEWEQTYRGARDINLQQLNDHRKEVLEPLAALREAFAAEGATVSTVTEALRAFLERAQASEKLDWYGETFRAGGEAGLVKEYGQALGLVEELFDRLESLLGEERVSRKEYAKILEAGFDEISVGAIPATIDRVVVGDLTRTRLDQVKILFFVGVNEGIVPQKKESRSLLTDQDREFLADHDLELAPTSREDICIQRFYQYLILSKPSWRLALSYSATSPSGGARRPAHLLSEIQAMFPALELLEESRVEWPIQTGRAGIERLAKGLMEKEELDSPEFRELYRWFFGKEEWRDLVKALTQAAFSSYEERGIGRAAARALYGTILQGSVTRLELYASCAYAHFLKYGLELLERQEYELAAQDLGELFHRSIDRCFQRARDQRIDLANVGEAERKALVKACVAQVTEEYGNSILKNSARNAYLAGRVERITDRTVWALGEQLKKGDFVPMGFEVSFQAADDLKAMKIPLSADEALYLRGRIDRLDLCADEDHVYVKIIDYKSGSMTFDLTDLYYGLQLQLVVYMDAAMEREARRNPGKEIVPAGIFYYNIKDPVIDWEPEQTKESVEGQILGKLRMNGLVNSDLEVIRHIDREIERESQVIPVAMKAGLIAESKSSVASRRRFEALREYVRGKLKAAGREILSGNVPVNPYKRGDKTGCDYCPYHAVCGFDKKTAGYGYRNLRPRKPEEIWEEILPQERKEAETDGSQVDGRSETGH